MANTDQNNPTATTPDDDPCAPEKFIIAQQEMIIAHLTELAGLLTVCASCKRVRSQQHDWIEIDSQLFKYINTLFSHGLCATCISKLYPSYASPYTLKPDRHALADIQAAILVVDDEPDLVENIQMALESQDYQVLTAKNGFEALATLQTQPVDLIISDVSMPAMSGPQLYEHIQQNPSWQTIPFILLTSHSEEHHLATEQASPHRTYLPKPVRLLDLLAAVKENLY